MSIGLITCRVVGVTQVETDFGQKFFVENDFACNLPGRIIKSPSPLKLFVPDLVMMFRAGPEVQPYSAENAFERTLTS